jgi:hypothetical protein
MRVAVQDFIFITSKGPRTVKRPRHEKYFFPDFFFTALGELQPEPLDRVLRFYETHGPSGAARPAQMCGRNRSPKKSTLFSRCGIILREKCFKVYAYKGLKTLLEQVCFCFRISDAVSPLIANIPTESTGKRRIIGVFQGLCLHSPWYRYYSPPGPSHGA